VPHIEFNFNLKPTLVNNNEDGSLLYGDELYGDVAFQTSFIPPQAEIHLMFKELIESFHDKFLEKYKDRLKENK